MRTTVTIIREVEIEVEAHYFSGTPATHLQPEEHANVEIINAHVDGDRIELTDDERDEVIEMIIEDPPQRDYYDD